MNPRGIIHLLKNPRRFSKHVELRGNVVPDPRRNPFEGAIFGNLERTIGAIPRNMRNRAAKAHVALSHRFRNGCSTRELIGGNGIDGWGRSKRIEKDWGRR